MRNTAYFVIAALLVAAPAAAQPAARVGLAEAVARALAANPTAASAREAVLRAEALVGQARAGLFPTLSANAAYTHLDAERVLTTGEMRRTVSGQDQVRADLQLAVPLLAPLALNQTARAKDQAAVSRAAEADVRRQVALAAARAFLAVVSQRRVVEASERARDTARAHHQHAQARLAGGIGRSLDEVRAGQELAVSEVQLQAAHANLARAREALGVMIAAEVPADAAGDPDVEAAAGARVGTLPDALAAAPALRQDVQAGRARLAAATGAADDRWTFYAPYLAAIGTPFYQRPASLVNPEVGWQAALVLSLPLWDGGRRRNLFREQDAIAREARVQLDGQLRQARAEVRAAFEAMLRADRGLEAARESVRLARRALELATLAYQAGATSNIEVVDAERRARDAETAAAVAEDAARLARLELLAASGRFPGTNPRR